MPEHLTPQEEQAMRAIWKTGEGNVKTFLENVEGPSIPPYTTLASTVKNLEKKGYVQSRLIGNTYMYRPLIRESEYKKNFVTDLVKKHFDNSYKELVAFFAEQKKISQKDLEDIIDIIEKKKK